jgi:hypothetical protein
MMRLAKASELGSEREPPVPPDVILESLLSKGFTPDTILQWLREKKDSRDTYRSPVNRALRHRGIDAGYQPGRARYHNRDTYADIEVFYYH